MNTLQNQYTNDVRLGSCLNFSYILSKRSKFKFKNFFNQNGVNQTSIYNDRDANNNLTTRRYSLGYKSRTLYSTQFEGKHNFSKSNILLDYLIGYSFLYKNEPDLRRASYGNLGGDTLTVLYSNSGSDINEGSSRLYQKLQEHAWVGASNLTKKFSLFHDKVALNLNARVYLEYKVREFKAREFAYTITKGNAAANLFDNFGKEPVDKAFGASNISTANGFTIQEGTNLSNHYIGYSQLYASYGSFNLEYGKVKLLTGARFEHNNIELQTGDGDVPIHLNIPSDVLLPSANLSVNITKRQLIRLAFGKTVNRQQFRELVPFNFYDFDIVAGIRGNPNLKLATIDNYDVRYEYYPSPGDMISIAFFYKDMTNPIELTRDNNARDPFFT